MMALELWPRGSIIIIGSSRLAIFDMADTPWSYLVCWVKCDIADHCMHVGHQT